MRGQTIPINGKASTFWALRSCGYEMTLRPSIRKAPHPKGTTAKLASLVAAVAVTLSAKALAADSQCFGTVSKGRIERSVKLPTSGPNFSAYSTLAATAGRTHVHAK